MKRIIRYTIITILAILTSWQLNAQEDYKLILGANFDMYFDNREYADCDFGQPQTLFSSRLTPEVGIEWNGKNRLMAGMDLWSDFGNHTVTFSKARPQIYYSFNSEKVAAYAGIFSREKMLGHYSEAIMSDSMRFYDNRVQGVMVQYKGKRGYAEISADWCGMFSEASREKFRIMSAGRYYFDNYHRRFYGGYAFMMFHFAGSKLIPSCVNDQVVINPYIGTNFNAFFDFDIKLHYIQTFQCDRDNEENYRKPKGGMMEFRMTKWGAYLENQLYLGENLQPFYSSYRSEAFPNGYGGELYAGETFFGTTKHIYNLTKLGYNRWFFNNTVGLNCFFALTYDGTAMGNKQVVSVSVRLLKDIALTKKR